MEHPAVELLEQLVSGTLDEPQRSLLNDHLNECGECSRLLQQIRHATTDRTTTDAVGQRTGTQIGPYKLLELLGEGGMGQVFLAERESPYRDRVAIKLIKKGMDSHQVIARFEAERQALALMNHPNIASILDGGVTEDGQPYFVMELVRGVPLTDYCRDESVPLPERLQLFGQVCEAIQHAHQKGIIHRDIKPSNVLVELEHDEPIPKIIDFGVAKATNQPLTEKTVFTKLGQVVGTLEYMSPEQAQLNALDVDTRSDIYSLGVLLYELLTGTTPIQPGRLKQEAFDQALQLIREETPEKPSSRISRSGTDLGSRSNAVDLQAERIGKFVKGELDWIVMKALEKERRRRYASASEFSADIARFLRHEPVAAGPPSLGYRLTKTLQKHRWTFLGLATVSLLLIISVVGTTNGMLRARRAEATAQERLTSLRNNQTQLQQERRRALLAEERANRAIAQLSDYLADQQKVAIQLQEEQERTEQAMSEITTTLHQPSGQRARVVVSAFQQRMHDVQRLVLETIINHYDQLLRGDPENTAALLAKSKAHFSLAHVYTTAREPDSAVTEYERSLELLRYLSGAYPDFKEAHLQLALSAHNQSIALMSMGQMIEAESAQHESLDARRRLAKREPDNSDHRLAIAAGLLQLGLIRYYTGEVDAAIENANFAQQAAEPLIHAPVPGTDAAAPTTLVTIYTNLANWLDDRGRFEEALDYASLADAQAQLVLERNPDDLAMLGRRSGVLNTWSVILNGMQRFDDAIAKRAEGITIARRLIEQDPDNLNYRRGLAMLLSNLTADLGRRDQYNVALATATEAVQLRRDLAGRQQQNLGLQAELGRSLFLQAVVELGLDQEQAAEKQLGESLFLLENAAAKRPDVEQFREWLDTTKQFRLQLKTRKPEVKEKPGDHQADDQ